ncbi:hypothetical protein [Nonomuraea turcica]|uniref:hypothetical protein n=1 Tax=Nonomuraea sp. G32 TaxID=3067274 RepID=UPI00273B476D|nr:hypothetical protein [Nonomuraea sp. G32]MDP4508638.1 hypothetical protein [Nonomuraea sp. G32]
MNGLEFYLRGGSVEYRCSDDRLAPLAVLLSSDVGNNFGRCLDVLDSVSKATAGEKAQEYPGNIYTAIFVGDTVRVEHNFLEETAEYGLGDVQRAAEEYWTVLLRKPDDPNFSRHLRPDLPEYLAYLYFWEETWQEPHPYRGRLGIPAQGSE